MAWVDLGITIASKSFEFVEYGLKLCWLEQSGSTVYVKTCNTDGSNVTIIGTFSNIHSTLCHLRKFKDDIYFYAVTNPDTTYTKTLYKYSGSGTTWSTQLNVTSCPSLIYSFACSDTIAVICISEDYSGVFDVRYSTDGTTWSSVSKGTTDGLSSLFYTGDINENIFGSVGNEDDSYKRSTCYITSTSLNTVTNITDLGLFSKYQIGCNENDAAATYYTNDDYDIYRSLNYGTTRYLTFEDAYFSSDIFSFQEIDFIVFEPSSGLNLYYYKDGDTETSFTLLESVDSILTSASDFYGVTRIYDELYLLTYDKIYKNTEFIDWVVDPVVTTNQLLQNISTPFMGGNYFWDTWLDDETMYLHKRSLANGSIISSIDVGTVTVDDLLVDKTYSAHVTAYSDLIVYVWGKLNNPQGLGSCHVIKSVDGGTTWSVLVDSWGDDHCGALIVGVAGNVWAIRNGSTTQLYGGTSASLSQYSTLPFSKSVNRGNLVIANNGVMYAASGEANAIMVAQASPPYTKWIDITNNHPVTKGINRLVPFV